MTLGQFLNMLSENPSIPIFFFIALPLTAFLASIFGKDEGHISPWKYMYTTLVYLACIPGIFAVTLCVYMFLFERQSVLDINIYTQILPIICMGLTLWLIKKNVEFDEIPGFGKIPGLIMIITALITLMWISEKMHIFAITIIPFHYFALIFLVILFGVRFGWQKMVAENE